MSYILYILLPFFSFTLNGEKYKLVKSISSISGKFTTDNLGNIYLIRGSVLEKYSAEGNLLKSYSNKALGTITSVDVSNPMRVLVFYEAFQQVVVLDNMFVPSTAPIMLESLGYNQVSLVAASHNNGMWVYNKQNFELIRFDQNLQITHKADNIFQQTGLQLNPVFLLEYNNQVFLNDSAHGILIFDIYGLYNKTIPLTGLADFQVVNENIIYFNNGKMKGYNMKTLAIAEIILPTTDILYARSEKEKLYLLKQKSLEIYHVQIEK
jgi:hypothetical protein